MFNVLAAAGAVGAFQWLTNTVHHLRVATDVWAAERRGETRVVVPFALLVTRKEFEKVIQHPDIIRSWERIELLKNMGALPLCSQCGQVQRAGCA